MVVTEMAIQYIHMRILSVLILYANYSFWLKCLFCSAIGVEQFCSSTGSICLLLVLFIYMSFVHHFSVLAPQH